MDNNIDKSKQSETPLTNETFERIMKEYMELKTEYEEVENQRTDHKLNSRSTTNFFLFFIALYCLFRFIIEIIPIILNIAFVKYIIEQLSIIFQ